MFWRNRNFKKYHIEIKDNVTPVVTPVRKIPLALKPKLEKELKRMVDLDIIEPLQNPTDRVNGLVVVEKPIGKLWVRLDPRPLNKAIKHEHLHLPTAKEIFSQMSGASCFSKLDASSGYWQIKVDKQSLNLLTFGTPSGRYCFKCLPMEAILQVKFFRGKLRQFFRTYQAVQIPKTTS